MSRSRRSALRRQRATLAAGCAGALLVTVVSGCSPGTFEPAAAPAPAPPGLHPDAVDATTRLDLADARLEQIAGGQLALQITTHGPWGPADVGPARTRELCVWLRNELARTPGGRLCVVPDPKRAGKVRLRHTLLDHRGERLGIRDLSSAVQRPRPTTITALLNPALLRLVPGAYGWQVRSRSRRVEDRLPDGAELKLTVRASTAPAARERCFGAASRDPQRPCRNPRLRRAVVPTPDEALLSTNSPCSPVAVFGELNPCRFGVPQPDASATIALVGDSHAAHWRAALEQVAQHKRWAGISLTTSGCPLSRAEAVFETATRTAACARWNSQLPRWLARHREIHTVFVVQHATAEIAIAPGASILDTRAAGYAAAWKALPASVRRIVVIRDTPLLGFQNACVRRVAGHGGEAAAACAMPRDDKVLVPDAAVIAAHRLHSRRVRVIDLTHYFCGAQRCPPVIGGALVYKDYEHITGVYATTLAPYLLRAIDGL